MHCDIIIYKSFIDIYFQNLMNNSTLSVLIQMTTHAQAL